MACKFFRPRYVCFPLVPATKVNRAAASPEDLNHHQPTRTTQFVSFSATSGLRWLPLQQSDFSDTVQHPFSPRQTPLTSHGLIISWGLDHRETIFNISPIYLQTLLYDRCYGFRVALPPAIASSKFSRASRRQSSAMLTDL